MTGHTCLSGRHAGEGRRLDAGVAISAIDAQTGDMVIMAERDWLFDDPAHVSGVIALRPEPPPAHQKDEQKRCAQNRHFGNKIKLLASN